MTETTDPTTDEYAQLRSLLTIDLETETIDLSRGSLVPSYAMTEVAIQLAQHGRDCECPAVAATERFRQMVESVIHTSAWDDGHIPLDHFPVLYECLYWLVGQDQRSPRITLDALTLAAREAGINTDMAERIKAVRIQLRDTVSEFVKTSLEKSAAGLGLPTVMLKNAAADITERVMRESGFAIGVQPLYGLEDPPEESDEEEPQEEDAPEGLLDLLSSLPDLLRSGGAIIGVATLERVPVGDSKDEPEEGVAE